MSELAQRFYIEANRLNEAGVLTEDAANHMLIEHFNALNRLFPGSITHHEDPGLKSGGKIAYRYYLRVGSVQNADDAFTYGRSLEVGGPSPYSDLRTIKGVVKPSLVTNISLADGVHEVADARSLPYPDASFSAFLAMHPPGFSDEPKEGSFRKTLIDEAYRVLEPGGTMLLSGASMDDLTMLLDKGFAISIDQGCIDSWIAVDADPSGDTGYSMPRMHMEILLHK